MKIYLHNAMLQSLYLNNSTALPADNTPPKGQHDKKIGRIHKKRVPRYSFITVEDTLDSPPTPMPSTIINMPNIAASTLKIKPNKATSLTKH